jgi:histidinol-phosphate phosphatase family protein
VAVTVSRSAVFLDKDGTLLDDVPFNVDPQRMRFADGVPQALSRFARLDVALIVVSNQAGVALGRFDAACLDAVCGRLEAMFAGCGATLAAAYFCPHHPGGSVAAWAVDCNCRKPRPGLLQQAAREHAIDLQRSWMIGDILDDVEAGKRAGCRSVLVCNGNETEWRGGASRTPDHLVRDFAEAADLVVKALAPSGASVPA